METIEINFKQRLASAKEETEKALAILDLIERAEKRMKNELHNANTFGYWFNSIRESCLHKAEISRMAMERLKNYYNILISEIQL